MKKASVALMIALGAGAMAQNSLPTPATFVYFPGRTIQDQKISLKGWGSGTISQTDEAAWEGTQSLRVSTRNYFQGGIMTFGEPKDLSDRFEDKSNLFKVTFLLADQSLKMNAKVVGESEDGGVSIDTVRTGTGGAVALVTRGWGGGVKEGLSIATTKVKALRFIITTTDGKRSEAYVPLTTTMGIGKQGWRSVAIPLQAINGFDKTNKIVKEIAFAADTLATFFVGDIRVENDTTDINGEILNIPPSGLNLALGDQVTLEARGFGGASVLLYQWDFDDRDGIQVDTEGILITRKFRKAGQYNVTLTVADAYGLKKPFRTSFPVRVNP